MAIVPYFVYPDGAAAVRFLVEAFGLEQVAAFEDERGTLIHAELRFGGCHVMLGTATREQLAEQPWDRPDGHGVYLVVDDVDAHFARAQAAGAEIVQPPEQTEFAHQYRARDLGGYEWTIGTYRPGGG